MSLNILSLPLGLDACSYYRVRKPFQSLSELGHNTHIIDPYKDDMMEVIKVLGVTDVVFMRQGSEKGVLKIRGYDDVHTKAKFVMDIDDNIEQISPDSQFYAEYGLEEVEHDGVSIWKQGEKGFDLINNLSRVTYIKYGLSTADLVLVTTNKLAEYARQFNKNVFVNYNSIDFTHWWRLNNKQNQRLRVIWQGSPSHYEDWVVIKEPLNKLMSEYDFELYMLGSNYMGLFDDKFKDRIHTLPWVPFEAHSYRMMSLQPDIALIPLVSSDKNDEFYQEKPFNQYKSSIKWYEMSAMGVPSLVSNVIPYSLEIEDNKTALGYKTQSDFYKKFKMLLENRSLRQNIGNSAYQWVKKNRDQKVIAKKLAQTLENLCQK